MAIFKLNNKSVESITKGLQQMVTQLETYATDADDKADKKHKEALQAQLDANDLGQEAIRARGVSEKLKELLA